MEFSRRYSMRGWSFSCFLHFSLKTREWWVGCETAAECSGGPSDTAPGPHLPHLKEGIVGPEAHGKFPGQQRIMNIMALVRPAHSSGLL